MMVFRSMSDIRTKLLLGTSVGALAMIFVMAAGVDVLSTETGTAVQGTGLNGHITAIAIHPDGSMSYSQGDNAIQDTGLENAASQLFNPATAVAGNVFDCISIGTGTVVGNAADIHIPMVNVVTAAQSCGGGSVLVAGAPVGDIAINAVFTMLATDLLDNGATTVTVTEATLEDSGGTVLSKVDLAAGVTGNLGTEITITYTMTVS